LPVHTYSGRATSKPGVNPDDHTALVRPGEAVVYAPGEAELKNTPLEIVIENESVDFNPLSRLDFGKIYTIHFNWKVRTMGRIEPNSLKLLEEYFKRCVGIEDDSLEPLEE
jgi:hypothetical protein